jgi:plasmid stabilization system protein ParE
MKIRYTATAHAELEAILSRIDRESPRAATAVARVIKTAIAGLSSFPRIGARTDAPGIFVKISRTYRYLVFYRIAGDTVIIRNIRHPARHWAI